jgi:hypothetical protein
MPDPVSALAGATVGSAFIGSRAAGKAGDTAAGAADRAAQLQFEQYLQSREDLAPYRNVATGGLQTEFNKFKQEMMQYYPGTSSEQLDSIARWKFANDNGIAPEELDIQLAKPAGGALGELSNYGTSKVDPGEYIPESDIPQYNNIGLDGLPAVEGGVPDYNVQGDVSQFDYQNQIPEYNVDQSQNAFNVQGDIPEFDSTQFDIYKDPSYEWRKDEALRAVNRENAPGKLNSGNRLVALQDRASNLASTEYGAARDRMVQDYGIRRENEATGYGRDLTAYDANRAINQEGYSRANTAYDINRQNEANMYGRATGEYGLTRAAEDARYGRDLTGYEADRQNALTRYGFSTDAYNRAYGLNTDQYGRNTDAYNANVGRENALYNRGVGNFNIAAGQETDYLNRLAALSQVGQTATNATTTAGTNYASNAGNAMIQGGNAQAAGIVGQSNAISNGVNQLSYLYGQSQQPQYYPPPTQAGFAGYYGTNPGSQQSNMLYNQMYGPMTGL